MRDVNVAEGEMSRVGAMDSDFGVPSDRVLAGLRVVDWESVSENDLVVLG